MSILAKHILVADNDPDTLAGVELNLKMAGYQIFTASTPERAKQLLEEEIIHLAIIDMRLRDDKQIEYSGFEVASQVPPHIPFIIYTAFEDADSVKRALVRFGAKESLDKKKPGAATELIETVDRLFKSEVKVKFDLQIEGEIICEDIAMQIEIPAERKPQPTAEDIYQIFQALFYEADSIFISPLLPPERLPALSQSGSVVLLVRPLYKSGWGESRVVKLSACNEIKEEEQNYYRIKRFLGGTRLAMLDGTAFSRQIGGVIYSLIDAEDWDTMKLFSDYYRENDGDSVSALLERFFVQTFGTIFADAKHRSINLTKDYSDGLRLTPQKLKGAIDAFRPNSSSEPHLCFKGVKGTFVNPVTWMLLGDSFRKFEVVSKTCLCHGDLHGRNILVNSMGNFWLIDFARANESHALRDFIELETDIKFNIMRDADLTALLPFECALLAQKRFRDRLPCVQFKYKSLANAYKTIISLRRIAANLLVLGGEMREYYQALLLNTLNMLRLKHISAEKKEHALLAASLICQRLMHWPEWELSNNYESLLVSSSIQPATGEEDQIAQQGEITPSSSPIDIKMQHTTQRQSSESQNSYGAFNDLESISQRKSLEGSVTNIHIGNITVGEGANVRDIVLANEIQRSFNKAESANIQVELKEALKRLAEAVDTMNKSLPQDQATEAAEDLSRLVDEVTKPTPNKKWYSVSIDGLIKAAENVGRVGEPVIHLSQKILSLLNFGLTSS